MKNIFSDKSVLLIHPDDKSGLMLQSVLKIIGFENVDLATGAVSAYEFVQNQNVDVVIGKMNGGQDDVVTFYTLFENDSYSIEQPPILAISDHVSASSMALLRGTNITDMIQQPYSLDDISSKLRYVLSLSKTDIQNRHETYQKQKGNLSAQKDWPEASEAKALTDTLLDHYFKHHEIVFKKLKIAQDATHHCIEEVRETYKKVREKDNTNILGFKDFDKMWEDVLNLFVKGGLAEEDLFEIEKLVSVVPKDIRARYDIISQQDKSFLALVDSLNATAYKKAKERVVALQAQPNPYTGRTSADYKNLDQEKGKRSDTFKFKPKIKGEDS